jgi:hypothetical protein
MQELVNRIGQAIAAFLELEPGDNLTADRGYYLFNTLKRLYEADDAIQARLEAINNNPSYVGLSQILELATTVLQQRPEMIDQFEADLESGPMTPPGE